MSAAPLRVAFEPGMRRDQDSEYCVVELGGRWREIRFHDYAEIYRVPGLYEYLFHDLLECRSPEVVVELLYESADRIGDGEVRALDLGAGNGLVGERLRRRGARTIVGLDILPEAREAALRDRGHAYDDYRVCDASALGPEEADSLRSVRFNVLTCVAALGFGDIPPEAFQGAFDLLEPGGLVGFNLNERFARDGESSGFADLLEKLGVEGHLETLASRSYVHRLATSGEPIRYRAFVGLKEEPAAHP